MWSFQSPKVVNWRFPGQKVQRLGSSRKKKFLCFLPRMWRKKFSSLRQSALKSLQWKSLNVPGIQWLWLALSRVLRHQEIRTLRSVGTRGCYLFARLCGPRVPAARWGIGSRVKVAAVLGALDSDGEPLLGDANNFRRLGGVFTTSTTSLECLLGAAAAEGRYRLPCHGGLRPAANRRTALWFFLGEGTMGRWRGTTPRL